MGLDDEIYSENEIQKYVTTVQLQIQITKFFQSTKEREFPEKITLFGNPKEKSRNQIHKKNEKFPHL
jgi:hypothetical protein